MIPEFVYSWVFDPATKQWQKREERQSFSKIISAYEAMPPDAEQWQMVGFRPLMHRRRSRVKITRNNCRIIGLAAKGMPQAEIGRRLGIHPAQVNQALRWTDERVDYCAHRKEQFQLLQEYPATFATLMSE